MKKILLITIFLLLQSFSSFGSPEGKNIICKCYDCILNIRKDPQGFVFQNGKVINHYLMEKNGIYNYYKDYNINPYKVSLKYIEWWWSGQSFHLNRKTLELTRWYGQIQTHSECKLQNSHSKYMDELKKIMNEYQVEYNKKLKELDNKI